MISCPRRRAAVTLPVTALVAVGAGLATTSFAAAATAHRDLAIRTSALQFQPPATIPDAGTATIRVTNVGTTRPSAASIEVNTVSRLRRVTANGLACRVVNLSSGTDVARCTIQPTTIPAPQRSATLALTVEINSPPGNCSCVPFTVRLITAGDSNPANNVAVASIIR